MVKIDSNDKETWEIVPESEWHGQMCDIPAEVIERWNQVIAQHEAVQVEMDVAYHHAQRTIGKVGFSSESHQPIIPQTPEPL